MVEKIRPTRFMELSRSVRGLGYELPADIILPSGFIHKGICMVDTHHAFAEALVSEELIVSAGGPRINNVSLWKESYGPYNASVLPISIDVPRIEDVLHTSFLSVVSTLPKGIDILFFDPVLESLGDFAVSDNKNSLQILYPKVSMFQVWTIDELIEKAVLILGRDDSSNISLLKQVEVAVNQYPNLRAWLLKDYHDIPGRDLVQKLMTMASCSRLIIVDDSATSGHLVELSVLSALQTPTAILRQEGRASSWMVDPVVELKRAKIFHYDLNSDITSLRKAVMYACSWANEQISEKAKTLDDLYPWRKEEIHLANKLDGIIKD